jgi:hypothetical protein
LCTFTFNLLRNVELLFVNPACKQNVIYFYNQWQEGFKLFKEENIVKEWISALPSTEDIETKTLPFKHNGGSIIVIDDFAEQLNKDTVQIFTRMCHHNNFVLILLTQNIFNPNPVFRTISLNATYVLMFKNPRDASQINCFAKQFMPGGVSWVVNAFKEATRRAHSYLLFDSSQYTPDMLRIRSHTLPSELPLRIYMDQAVGRQHSVNFEAS